jgi:hypothetical protein
MLGPARNGAISAGVGAANHGGGWCRTHDGAKRRPEVQRPIARVCSRPREIKPLMGLPRRQQGQELWNIDRAWYPA